METEREGGFSDARFYWREFRFRRLRWLPIGLIVEANKTIISVFRRWVNAKFD